MCVQRISVHITDETKQRIGLAAKAKQKVEADLIREAINEGLKKIYPPTSTQALLNLAKRGKNFPSQSEEPTDISEDTAKYAFGKDNE
jgi:predicted DNA-binding protein